jgi:hypothetical protein
MSYKKLEASCEKLLAFRTSSSAIYAFSETITTTASADVTYMHAMQRQFPIRQRFASAVRPPLLRQMPRGTPLYWIRPAIGCEDFLPSSKNVSNVQGHRCSFAQVPYSSEAIRLIDSIESV